MTETEKEIINTRAAELEAIGFVFMCSEKSVWYEKGDVKMVPTLMMCASTQEWDKFILGNTNIKKPMSNPMIYDGEGRIWEDWQEPKMKDFELSGSYLQAHHNWEGRPSNPVHPDLQKKWVKGQKVVRDVDYLINERCYVDYPTMGENDCVSGIEDEYCRCQTAIPLPVENNKPDCYQQEERKFTLDEMKTALMDAINFEIKEAYKYRQFTHPAKFIQQYFKEKFNIDL